MRRLFMFMMVSLDGCFEGPGHDISRHNAKNEEFKRPGAGTPLFAGLEKQAPFKLAAVREFRPGNVMLTCHPC